jgi:hydroxymethylbilane synthase
LGDLNLNDPLWKMPEKGVFTEDFVLDLTEGRADMVVHSWKDLPTEPRKGTKIVATLARADVRDVLLFRRDKIREAARTGRVRVLSSSPRRAYNLNRFLREHLPFAVTEINFENVRGNIPTRLKKLLSQDVEGLVVAKAALDRLLEAGEAEFSEAQSLIRSVLTETQFMVLPLSANPTAAAQGALAIEISEGRPDLEAILDKINCRRTAQDVEAERRVLASYGGGCHQKIGINILPRAYGDLKFLKGLTDQGQILDEVSLTPPERQPFARDLSAIFPAPGEEASLFARESLTRENWAWIESEDYIWVARADAWPAEFQAKSSAVVWTSGLKTWRKLAQRGIWVSGSAEGLGEDEAPRIETLLGVEPRWIKLSHADSETYATAIETGHCLCATYKLRPLPAPAVKLKGRTHFYWMSASSFSRALELEPSIRGAYHAAGPGNTARHLRRVLGEKALIGVHLSVDDWRRAVLSREASLAADETQ